jgi:hypothetical protein
LIIADELDPLVHEFVTCHGIVRPS